MGGSDSPFLTSFIGRHEELRAVVELLRANRLVTVLGTGGLGKTRLAFRVFDVLREQYDHAWAVDLSAVVEAPLLAQTVAAHMGLPAPADNSDIGVLIDALGTQPCLLLLDNCEHLVDAAATFVSSLLTGCPNLRVVTTSRQALGIAGEAVYHLPAMEVTDAVALFTDRAQTSSSGWSVSASNQGAVNGLCVALEGHPLAVELAAGQIRAFSPQAMLDRLSRGPELLGGGFRGSGSRGGSLEDCLRWSYDLCTEAERVLWARLSTFGPRMSLEAVEEVCATDGLGLQEVAVALVGLVDKSLLVREADDTSTRYRMLEVVRQFGQARLAEGDEPDRWRRRHRDYYLRLAEAFDADWMGPRQAEWIDQLRHEHANLSLAFEFSVRSPEEAPRAMRMCAVLEHYFAATGSGAEALHWIQLALAHGTGTAGERAMALRVGCFIATLLAQLEDASAMYDELMRLVESEDDPRIKAFADYAGAMLRTWQGDAEAGAELACRGIELLHQLGDVAKEANLCFLRGMMLGWADRADEAAASYQRCLDLTQPRGERWLTSYSQWGLGVDALIAGDLDKAEGYERAAVQTKVVFGDLLGIGLTTEVLAWVAAERGAGRETALLLGAAEAIWGAIGMTVANMPYLLRRREIGIATAKGLLPQVEFERLLAEGRELTRDEALEVALGVAPSRRRAPVDALTPREQEIAQLVAEGESNRAIADQLVVSVRTVETHVENLLRKLDVSSRGQVARALAGRAPGR